MLRELKEKLIHWLGGYTFPAPTSMNTNIVEICNMKIIPLACSMVVTDKIPVPEEYIKRDIAHRIGETIVENDYVEYTSEPCEFGTKLIAKIYIGKK